VWDNQNLKLTFRRNFSPWLIEQMYALEAIAQGITFSFDTESLVWAYNSSRVYSTSSLYGIINFRGVQQVHMHPFGS
jgi:hypothetical protein